MLLSNQEQSRSWKYPLGDVWGGTLTAIGQWRHIEERSASAYFLAKI